MERPKDLPDYDDPPIDEVALGVQFDAIAGFTDVHAGIVWIRLQNQYPRIELHPPTNIPIEDLTRPPSPIRPGFSFEHGAMPSRTWLIGADDSELLQLQNTQLMFNWRRRGQAGYPHLEHISDQFAEGYQAFHDGIEDAGLEPTTPQQIELSYFNWLPGPDPAALFRPAPVPAELEPTLEPEEFATRWSFIDRRADKPVARLRVEFAPALRKVTDAQGSSEPTRGYRLTLSYRAPMNDDEPWEAQVKKLAQWGRETIVRTFTVLTTDSAHTQWGRIQ